MSPASKNSNRSGPGRGSPRSRTVSRPRERARTNRSPAEERTPTTTPTAPTPVVKLASRAKGLGLTFTWRLLATAVVIMMLVLSYASSAMVYFRQQQQIADTKAQIEKTNSEITSLEDEVKRWKDPNFVKAQARARLGWVVPGEIGYKVIGPDGKVIGGGVEIETQSKLPSDEHPTVWWERMVGSVKTADDPTPVEETPGVVKPPPTEQPSPSTSATPKR